MKASSWGLIEQDGEYLFIERSGRTSRAGQWCPPGGGRKPDESQEDACVREVKEEVGLDVVVTSLLRNDERFYYYLCKPAGAQQMITLKLNECSSYRWVNPDELLDLGEIMELKRMVRVFSDLGYTIVIPDL